MADTNPQQAGSEAAAAPAQAAGEQQQTRTPEQVEAEWQAKQTALGRQHAAVEQALRDQLAALEAKTKASGERTDSEDDAIRIENERLKKLLADKDMTYAAEMRKVKYPLAAEALDPTILASMDEARLAGLEARLSPVVGQALSPRVESSTPPRQVTEAKPLSEKTAAELRADLERAAPAFLRELQASLE